jgi:hypothetical protein
VLISALLLYKRFYYFARLFDYRASIMGMMVKGVLTR